MSVILTALLTYTAAFLIWHLLLYRNPQPPHSTLFPYTTLFRSCDFGERRPGAAHHQHHCGPRISDVHAQRDGCRVEDRKSTRLNSSHLVISYAVFCLKKKNQAEIDVSEDVLTEGIKKVKSAMTE